MFDSGVGGLSVLVALRRILPDADLLYVADRARAPYGTRSLTEVKSMALEVATWLVERGASTLVVACNTASAAGLEAIRAQFPGIPVVGMEPALKPAASLTRSGVVAVLATRATFQGRLFATAMERHGNQLEVRARACPEWVVLVEDCVVEGPRAEAAVRRVVDPLLTEGVDTIVLGCTHFSFLLPVIERVAGPDITIIDPASAVAAQAARVSAATGGRGRLTFAASGNGEIFAKLVASLTDMTVQGAPLPFSP